MQRKTCMNNNKNQRRILNSIMLTKGQCMIQYAKGIIAIGCVICGRWSNKVHIQIELDSNLADSN